MWICCLVYLVLENLGAERNCDNLLCPEFRGPYSPYISGKGPADEQWVTTDLCTMQTCHQFYNSLDHFPARYYNADWNILTILSKCASVWSRLHLHKPFLKLYPNYFDISYVERNNIEDITLENFSSLPFYIFSTHFFFFLIVLFLFMLKHSKPMGHSNHTLLILI